MSFRVLIENTVCVYFSSVLSPSLISVHQMRLLLLTLWTPLAASMLGHARMHRHPFVRTTSARMDETHLPASALKRALLDVSAEFKEVQLAQWQSEAPEITATNERVKSPLKAEGFGNVEIKAEGQQLSELKQRALGLIEDLARMNPSSRPFEGWKTASGCRLEGTWELRFTTGADATFRPSESTGGTPITFQTIDTRKGLFVNCIDFGENAKSRLTGFRVVVAGRKLSDSEIALDFRRVKLLRRRSRFPFLRSVIIPLPPGWLLRGVARWASRGKAQLSQRGAGFEMLYLDEDLRIHKTFDGQYFVQQRRAGERCTPDNICVAAEPLLTEDATASACGEQNIRDSGAPDGFVWGGTY